MQRVILQLTPAGVFTHRTDGTPHRQRMTAADAARVLREQAARKTPLVIDYDYQTALARYNGQPAPAAGWIEALHWQEGVGLSATVSLTERGAARIRSGSIPLPSRRRV